MNQFKSQIFLAMFIFVNSSNISTCYSDEPLPQETLYEVEDFLSPSLIKLTNGEIVRIIGVEKNTSESELFLSELKEYLGACCHPMLGSGSVNGAEQPLFIAYFKYDPQFEKVNHRDKDNHILAYVYPQSFMINIVGEIKFGGLPMTIVPANPAENMVNSLHTLDFMQRQEATLRAANIKEVVLKGEKPNASTTASVDNSMNFLKDIVNQQTGGQKASPGKSFFLNATIIRSGFGLADQQSKYKEKNIFADYQKAAEKQKTRLHNPDDINERKIRPYRARPMIPLLKKKTSEVPKTDNSAQSAYEPNVPQVLKSMGDKRKSMRTNFGEERDLKSYYEELGIKKES